MVGGQSELGFVLRRSRRDGSAHRIRCPALSLSGALAHPSRRLSSQLVSFTQLFHRSEPPANFGWTLCRKRKVSTWLDLSGWGGGFTCRDALGATVEQRA